MVVIGCGDAGLNVLPHQPCPRGVPSDGKRGSADGHVGVVAYVSFLASGDPGKIGEKAAAPEPSIR